MSGAFTHLTLVGLLAAPNELDRASNFPNIAKATILDNTLFCDLGSVSPDYPYLKILGGNSCAWADLMHYEKTDRMIISGVEYIRSLDDRSRSKPFAWFLGFIAHIVADMTIHPVVLLKVGPYEENKTEHRKCEMNQDAYVFPKLSVGNIGMSEYLDSGIAKCVDPEDGNILNRFVFDTWSHILKETYPDQYKKNIPNINGWHSDFLRIVDNFAEEGHKLCSLVRSVAVDAGLTYPCYEDINLQYIKNLETPDGSMHFENIFERAKDNILAMWEKISCAVYENDDTYKKHIDEWNLDTGCDSNNNLVFWKS